MAVDAQLLARRSLVRPVGLGLLAVLLLLLLAPVHGRVVSSYATGARDPSGVTLEIDGFREESCGTVAARFATQPPPSSAQLSALKTVQELSRAAGCQQARADRWREIAAVLLVFGGLLLLTLRGERGLGWHPSPRRVALATSYAALVLYQAHVVDLSGNASVNVVSAVLSWLACLSLFVACTVPATWVVGLVWTVLGVADLESSVPSIDHGEGRLLLSYGIQLVVIVLLARRESSVFAQSGPGTPGALSRL